MSAPGRPGISAPGRPGISAPGRPGISAPGRRLRAVWRLLTGTGAAASIGLGLLVFTCVFLAVAAPRESLALRTGALRHALTTASPLTTTVAANADYTDISIGFDGPPNAQDLATAGTALAAGLTGLGLPLAAPAKDWSGLSTGFFVVTGGPPALHAGGLPPQLKLLYYTDLRHYARLVAGVLPSGAQVTGHGTVIQIAVTSATAARFALRPGARIGTTPGTGLTLLVTGIVRPAAGGATVWASDSLATAPEQVPPDGNFYRWEGAAFVGPAALPLLPLRLDSTQMSLYWEFPLDLGSMRASQAQGMQGKLIQAATQGGLLGISSGLVRDLPEPVSLSSGVTGILGSFIQQDEAADPVLSLLSVSLAVIAAVVVLLGVRLLAERRRGEFALLRARGASRGQVALLALLAGAVVTIPAAVAGAALAAGLTSGYATPLAWWLAGLIVVTALVGGPLIAFRMHRAAGIDTSRPEGSGRRVSRRAAGRRLAVEAGLLAAAVGGLILLRQQGLPAAGGANAYPSLAPVLVAIPAAIVVLRCYPAMMRGLLRLARHRPGATAFVGFARAARTPLTAGLPAFALVLALAVVAFGTMVRSAVIRGEVAASWQLIGADAVIDASASARPLTPAVQRAIAAVPGVQRTAAVLVTAGSVHGTALPLVIVHPGQYAALIADTPRPPFPASKLTEPAAEAAGPTGTSQAVPALASPGAPLGRGRTALDLGTRGLTIQVTGTAPAVPGVPGGAFVVLPWQALGSGNGSGGSGSIGSSPPLPTLMLVVGPHLDGSRLEAVVHRDLPGAMVTLRATELSSLTAAPLPNSAYAAIAAGSAAAAGLALLILLIALVLSAHPRELTLARLRVMGLATRQARWLVVAEVLPQVVVAAVGGVVCAVVLAPLVGPSIDLSSFTGTGAGVPIRPEPVPLAAVLVGLVALVLLTLAVESLIARRRGTPGVLVKRE
jgi:putative ABC transport system permease protein